MSHSAETTSVFSALVNVNRDCIFVFSLSAAGSFICDREDGFCCDGQDPNLDGRHG